MWWLRTECLVTHYIEFQWCYWRTVTSRPTTLSDKMKNRTDCYRVMDLSDERKKKSAQICQSIYITTNNRHLLPAIYFASIHNSNHLYGKYSPNAVEARDSHCPWYNWNETQIKI